MLATFANSEKPADSDSENAIDAYVQAIMRQFHLFYEVYAVMEKTDREGADKREGRLR